jgi:enoyl-CoA hydratase
MDVIFESRGRIGVVTLNRPQALNALTLAMVIDIDRRLASWVDDPGIAAVVIRSAGGRAFCAGGDIRALYEAGRRGDAYTRDFYREEYRLNHRIKTFPKPYVALIDGIVMGGGVGLSVHGSHRVASERSVFAMPETGIGFFPDVGGTWFLPRCPGQLGTYLGLTGARLGAADMLYCGIATHHCPSDRFESLLEDLGRTSVATEVLDRHATDAAPPPLARHRAVIDRCFAADTVEEILDRLDREPGDWAKETAALLRRKSPTSLKIMLRQLRLGAKLPDFAAAMRLEYRLSQRCVRSHDFQEGVRAAVIDKDQAPRWVPATLAEVDDDTVAGYFAPPDGPDLDLG